MNDVWATSDHHFDHKNILVYCDRPFKSVDHMNEALIERWNECVKADDIVYYLGDFTPARRAEKFIERLNGFIHFMPGSHDRWMDEDITRFDGDVWQGHLFLPALHEIKFGGHHITLCHYAMRSWPRSFHGSLHLYGHSHGRLLDHGRSMDIGVDTNDFYPYRLDQAVNMLKDRPLGGD